MTDKPQPGPNLVNCKSCGEVIDVSADPDNWPLQCSECKAAGVSLPKGYDTTEGSDDGA